jgi:LPS export ABC transporter permease LptG/LPS export ABC transporter permease LptF
VLKLFDRYVFKEIAPPFALGLMAYSFVLLMNQILLLSEMFIARGVALKDVLSLLIYLVPSILAFTVPMSVLMGILAGLGRMSSDSEITAFKTLGIDNRRLLVPILIFALCGMAGTAFLTLSLAPRANDKWVQTFSDTVLARVQLRINPREFNQAIPHTVIFVQDVGRDLIWRNVLVSLNPPGKDPRLVFAKRGRVNLHHEEKRATLELFEGTSHSYPPSSPEEYSVTTFERWEEELDVKGLYSEAARRKRVREKDIRELLRDIPAIEEEIAGLADSGRNPGLEQGRRRDLIAHWVEVHKKFALPCACLIFALVGIPLGASTRKVGRTGGFTISIVIIVVYYILITAGENLAMDGRLAPWLGMWGPNLLLFAGGLGLFIRSQKESFAGVFPFRRRKAAAPDPSAEPVVRKGERLRFPLRFPRTLDRYVIRRYLMIFLLAFASILAIFFIITFFEQIDNVYRYNKSISMLFDYIWYKLPEFIHQALPMTALAAALLSLGLMSKFNEITAVKTCGISLYRLIGPLVMLSLLICGVSFYIQENLLPYSNRKAEEVMGRITDRPPSISDPLDRRWLMSRDRNRIYHYQFFDPIAGAFSRMSILEIDLDAWSFRKRSFAEKASIKGTTLSLADAWEMEFADGIPVLFERREKAEVGLGEDQGYFQKEFKAPNQMRYAELEHYIEEIEERGFESLHFRVDLQAKLSFPLASLVMILLGTPFAFSMGRRGALVGIGLSIVIGMLYWGAIGVFKSMGYAGYLDVSLAAWGPNLLFGLIGIYLILKVRT